jgi:hypothetical protein
VRSRTAFRVRRLIRWWCVTVQTLLWVAILWHAPQYGFGAYSLMIAFTLMNLYVVYPLILGREGVKTLADLRAGRAAGATFATTPPPATVAAPTEG